MGVVEELHIIYLHIFILLHMYIILDFWTTLSKFYPAIGNSYQNPCVIFSHILYVNQISSILIFVAIIA